MRCKNCQICTRKPSASMKKTGFCKTCLPNVEDFLNGDDDACKRLNELENKFAKLIANIPDETI